MKDESRDTTVLFTQFKSHLAKIGVHCPKKVRDKAFFFKSRDNMIKESRGSVGEIASP